MSAHAILVADDEPGIRESLAEVLRDAGYRVETAADGSSALTALEANDFSVVVTDLRMPGTDGLTVLRRAHEVSPQTIVIIMTAHASVDTAIEALRTGAFDYVLKPVIFDDLLAKIARALEHRQAVWEANHLRQEAERKYDFAQLVGKGPQMAAVFQLITKVAPTQSTVLITGESGTGKEVLARYLHERSDRKNSPFVAVNLPAIPSELVESTLFGHEKGSFTGATRQAYGKFELANGGTLFLDELAELKLDVQAKLLRALQEREIERVGGARPIPVDLRVVCATNRSLEKLVTEGKFREDLYWRLKVVPIEIPPLRDRREDIRDLAQHFLARFAAAYGRPPQSLSEGAYVVLERYGWPGNIRELENLIERLVVICDAPVIDEAELPLDLSVGAGLAKEAEQESNYAAAMAAFERGYLRRVLAQNGWNRRRAAEQLGIGYSTLKAKLRLYGLAPDGDDD